MSLRRMGELVRADGVTEKNAGWWPRWLEKYARWANRQPTVRIEINENAGTPVPSTFIANELHGGWPRWSPLFSFPQKLTGPASLFQRDF